MNTEWTFGTLPDGRAVTAYRLRSPSGMEAVILDYGLILQSLVLPDGRNVTLGHETLEDYLSGEDYRGAIIGPNANRIVGAQFRIGDETFKLPTNDGANNLHSGPEGFDRQLWEIESEGDNLIATLLSKSAEGFPGALDLHITIALADQTLRVEMTATTNASTPVNLTWHPYWNLAGEGRIDSHDLQVLAEERTEVESGQSFPVKQTRFDFREPLPLGHIRLDDNFKSVEGTMLRSGSTALHIRSSLPDLQIYAGDALPVPRSGIAIEPQFQPNDVNLEQKSLLQPEETYHHWIEYHFTGLE